MISVVVPVYNVEMYLRKCIDSILDQTYGEIEVILVDDGSTDASGEICDKLCSIDSRVKVIHKMNGGLSDARNVGIDAANGEYISFVDSDDYIEQDMYSSLFETLSKTHADIAVCGINYVYRKKVEKISCSTGINCYDHDEALELLLSSNNFNASACNKLFRTELFEGIRFPVGRKFEDTAVMPYIFDKATKVVHIGEPKYNYLFRDGSITKSNFSERDFDSIDIQTNLYQSFCNRIDLEPLLLKNLVFVSFVCVDKLIINHIEKEFNVGFKRSVSIIKTNQKRIFLEPIFSTKIKMKTFILLKIPLLYRFLMKKNEK